MKGLLKNNFYAVRSNVKMFSAVMLLLGIFAAVSDNDSRGILIGYMILGMTGFSVIANTGLPKESSSKWCKYKVTAPVRRADIVKSYFLSQLIWLFAGMLFAAAGVTLSTLLHGFPFDRDTDIFMVFVVGIGLSLFMGASSFMNYLFGPHMTTLQIMTAGAAILVCAALAFLLSFPLTVHIFSKKEL